MFISIPTAILALTGLTQAITGLPTTVTCAVNSTSCEEACGPGYKSCGIDKCYNPDKLESCCAQNIICPNGSFCNPEGHGCAIPSYGPPVNNNTIMSTSMSMSMPMPMPTSLSSGTHFSPGGGYTFSGTASAITSLSSHAANGTIATASAPANLSTPHITSITASSFSNNTTSHPPSSATSIPSGISMGTPVTNLTYSGSIPSTTTTVAAPANTGAVLVVKAGGVVGMLVIVVMGAALAGL